MLHPVHLNGVFQNEQDNAPEMVPLGSALTRELQISATSHSTTSTSFQTELSENVILDREIFLYVPGFSVTVSAIANAATVNRALLNYIAARAWPLHSSIKNLNIGMNNNSLSVEPQLFINSFNAFNSDEQLERYSSMAPVFPDIRGNMVSLAAAVSDNRCPFNKYSRKGRSNWGYTTTITQAASGGAPEIIKMTFDPWTEPLQHPYLYSGIHKEGLKRLKNFRCDITWNSSFPSQCLENSAASVLDSNNAACTIAACVIDTTLSPKLLMRTYNSATQVPKVVKHSYQDFVIRPFEASLVTTGSGQVVSNSISFPQVPSKLMFFLRKSTDIVASTDVDVFAGITQLTINTDRTAGNLTSASNRQLYNMSVHNGLNQSFAEFSLYKGGPVLVDIQRGDLAGYIAGVNESFTFDFSLTASSLTSADTTSAAHGNSSDGGTAALQAWKCYCIAFFDKSLIMDGTQCISLGGFSKQALLEAVQAMDHSKMNVNVPKDGSGILSGGSWGSFLKGVKKVAGIALPLASMIAPNPLAKVGLQGVGSLLQGRGVEGGGLKSYG